MITVDNASYAINNMIEELQRIQASLAVQVFNNRILPEETQATRHHLSIISMQLSALADDYDAVIMNGDKNA